MAQANKPGGGDDTRPMVELVRVFSAPRALVFKAWSTAGHMKAWFSPEGFTVPEAEVDFRPGGTSAICMRAPDGQDFWSRGTYGAIVEPDLIEFTSSVVIDGAPKFTAHTTVTFTDDPAGTRMVVRQIYDIHDPAFGGAVDGAPEGWRTTLDKLEKELARMVAATRTV